MKQYEEAWQEYRRRRNLFLWAFLGLVPTLGLFALSTTHFLHDRKPVFAVGLIEAIFCAFASTRLHDVSCPSCGEPFFGNHFFGKRRRYALNDKNRCVYCGLREFADPKR